MMRRRGRARHRLGDAQHLSLSTAEAACRSAAALTEVGKDGIEFVGANMQRRPWEQVSADPNIFVNRESWKNTHLGHIRRFRDARGGRWTDE